MMSNIGVGSITGSYYGYSTRVNEVDININGLIKYSVNGRIDNGGITYSTKFINNVIDDYLAKFIAFLHEKDVGCYWIDFYGELSISENYNLSIDQIPKYFICGDDYTNYLYEIIFCNNALDIKMINKDFNEDKISNILSEIDSNAIEFSCQKISYDEDEICEYDINHDFDYDIVWTMSGNINGNMKGDIVNTMSGDINGNMEGDITGVMSGDINGNMEGDITGIMNGNIIGDLNGDIVGAMKGIIFGSINK